MLVLVFREMYNCLLRHSKASDKCTFAERACIRRYADTTTIEIHAKYTSKACISLSFTGFDQNKTEIKHDMKTKAVIYLGNDHFSYITYNIIIIIIIIIDNNNKI